MFQIPEPEYQRLRQLASELHALLLRIEPPVDPGLDARVAAVADRRDQWQSSHLYTALRPLRMGQVAGSLRRQGWIKVRRDAGIFWIKLPGSQAPSA